MELAKVTAEIRPRTPWEAVDLGFAMARRWWVPLTLSWLLASLPFLLPALILFSDKMWLIVLLIWWLKPLWERTQLYILSQALFGDVPSVYATLKACPKLMLRQIIASLTWRRLSPSRSMDLPVMQLENLGGFTRKQRLLVLHRQDSSPAGWLTIIGIHLESFIQLSIAMVLFSLLPEQTDIEYKDILFDPSGWVVWLNIVNYYIAVLLVGPFYVAAGFSLYLNRRILLEAWDIDIAFRRILERRNNQKRSRRADFSNVACQIGACLLLIILFAGTGSAPAYADGQPTVTNVEVPVSKEKLELEIETSKSLIEEVFTHSDFNNTKIIKIPEFLNLKEKEADEEVHEIPAFLAWLGAFTRYLAGFFRVVLWVALILLVIILIMRLKNWTVPWLQLETSGRRRYRPPKTLFGLDVRKESLPDDVSGEARKLILNDKLREALALLYRASLAHLLDRYQLPLRAGHTENECQNIVNKYTTNFIAEYFKRLTQNWVSVAYAHIAPGKDALLVLVSDWVKVIPEQYDNES